MNRRSVKPVKRFTAQLTQPYKYTFTAPVMCSQQLSLLRLMNKSLISKIYFAQCLFISKIIHLQKSYLLIRCYKTRFFLSNINNTDGNSVQKQNTHTKHSEIPLTSFLSTPPFLRENSDPLFLWKLWRLKPPSLQVWLSTWQN